MVVLAPAAPPTPDEVWRTRVFAQMGLSDAEYARIVELLGRRPNFLETGVYSVMWSEHCSYKSSKAVLRRFPTTAPHVLQGPGENAGIVDVGDGLAVAFKVESHNHPSALEPYQGAATGVGGIIRDVFTMGARPVALLDSLRFGRIDDGAPGSERNRYLLRNVVAGIAGYGNCIGIPTVGGEVAFDDAYRHNPLVNAMCVGVLRHDQIARGAAAGVGNPVLVVGARTGRDGIHGATFASTALDAGDDERSAVQVGDPFMEKLLLEACLELIATGEVVGIQDMGAAGLTSSSAEMASRAGAGLDLDLARVPRREQGMTPYEVMLSESQERMLVVMRAGSEHLAEAVFERWGLEVAVVGQVTGDAVLRLRDGDEVVGELPVDSLVDGAPEVQRASREPSYLAHTRAFDAAAIPHTADCGAALLQLLAAPTIASKRWIWRQYDHMVRASTVIGPGAADAAVVALRGTRKALAISIDCNARYVYLDPRRGGAHAVAEAARNVVCAGGEPLAITDCLNFASPEEPEVFWQFEQACAGIAEACEALGTPVVSGNVSLYNCSEGVDVHPTPVVGMVGLVADVDHATGMAFQHEGSRLYLVGGWAGATLAGSELLAVLHEATLGEAPPLDLRLERGVQQVVLAGIRAGCVAAAHDLSEGGLAVALAESVAAGRHGAAIALGTGGDDTPERGDALLFGEAGSRIVVEVPQAGDERFLDIVARHGVPLVPLGVVGGDRLTISVDGVVAVDASREQLAATWGGALSCLLD